YDPVTDSWTPIATEGATLPNAGHTSVWTGSEIILWGGGCFSGGKDQGCTRGAAFNPVQNTWRLLGSEGAPTSRGRHGAVWTGHYMIVWGGIGDSGDLRSRGLYDPASDSWSRVSEDGAPLARYGHAVAWTGHEMIVWGGSAGEVSRLASGGRFTP